MLREIVLDTETTGTDAKNGDRLIEIGCVELINHVQTGAFFHKQVNPMRPVSQGAFAVHGISDAMLANKPVFADIVDEFRAFCRDSPLVIHNAPFDVGFLNMEYARLGAAAPPPIDLSDVIDTLQLARRKHTGASNTLDALCVRYGIDTTRRTKHGALLDSQILAEVYVELLGGKQTSLGLAAIEIPVETGPALAGDGTPIGPRRLRHRLTPEESARHAAFLATLGPASVWRDYLGEDGTA
ncbi:DNA polymerase III subunit epsilon [Methylobacterium sp. J-090]|uniref:DNA polymerase III subunit epsilon n=1 Tax=Methylobacterium sp. J-090 TaxID=2836666 RepID=UPI001FBB38A3|nr:DNA polymerase III subunit epsilon [Methylobacterium sp. J-090]MCJ2080551.1 DNA polymerase III subunit epsilon [Methylobacterium sp. J-090]